MVEGRRNFLAREAVSGELLSERLRKGPIPPEEGLRLSIAIGQAIAQAHAQNKVHGGLCPFCIVITENGVVLTDPPSSAVDRAPYRSPEEFLGERADTRSDVFAFGAILYEVITARRAFCGVGEELREAIVQRGPQPFKAKSLIHTAMKAVMDDCLERDRTQRRQRIRNAVIELKMCRTLARNAELTRRLKAPPAPVDAIAAGAVPVPPVRTASPRAPSPAAEPVVLGVRPAPGDAGGSGGGFGVRSVSEAWDRLTAWGRGLSHRVWVTALVALAVTVSAVAAVVMLRGRSTQPTLEFSVEQPENTRYPERPAISPDGRYLTFSAAGRDGRRNLWLRRLDALHASTIPGSEGASAPFWSPDGESIAFFSGRSLKRVQIGSTAAPEVICTAEAAPGGGTWNPDGTILFAPGLAGGLVKVEAGGGKPQAVLKLDASKGERADLWPQFLPDGKHFVYYGLTDLPETSGVYVAALDGEDRKRLFASRTNAVYSSGYLLYIDEGNLMAVAFNPDRREVKDQPIVLGRGIAALRSLALAPVSVSSSGALAYQGVGKPLSQVVWLDRSGRQVAVSGDPAEYGPPRISPAGDRAAVARLDPQSRIAHLWLAGLDGSMVQLSSGPQHEGAPVWSPDGSRLAYFGRNPSGLDLYVRPARPGGGGQLLYANPSPKFATDWSHDGRYLIFYQDQPGTYLDIWGLSLPDRQAAPILSTVYTEGFAALSQDGKWMAFQSDQAGHNDVYVQAFDGLGAGTRRMFLVGPNGGLPHWRGDGGELFYITADGAFMSVTLHAAGSVVQAGKPQRLFQTRPLPGTWNLFDVSANGQRFVFKVPLEWTSQSPVTVVTNWVGKLKG